MLFHKFYIIVSNKENRRREEIRRLHDDSILLYNMDYTRGKALLSDMLKDKSMLCKNDNLDGEKIKVINDKDEDNDIKKAEMRIIKKILLNNNNNIYK
jgi:hypothetical protein